MAKYQHREAFALMWYACDCGHRERLWNSRDGVTPYGGLACPSCGGTGLRGGMSHVKFAADVCVQQFFRDGTAAEAVAIMARRIKRFASIGHSIPDDVAAKLLASAREQRDEWQPGWPMVDRFRAPSERE
jgi:hypothetical protein